MKYSLGLSSFPLMSSEISITAGIYKREKEWLKVREILIEENLLQRTRLSTRKVASNESIKRLKQATPFELEQLCTASDNRDRNFICLILVSRQYPLLLDLVTDLLIYKKDGQEFSLEVNEIQYWFEKLGETHIEIARLKDGSFKRLVLNTRKILIDGGLLQEESSILRIVSPGISSSLQRYYLQNGMSSDLSMMLKNNREIQQIKEARQ